MLVFAVVLSAACLGVLLGNSRVPQVRAVPVAGSLILTALLIAALFTLDPANVVLALVFIAVSALASALYAAWLWVKELPESPYGYSWYFVNEILRPGYTRRHFATIVDAREAESTSMHSR